MAIFNPSGGSGSGGGGAAISVRAATTTNGTDATAFENGDVIDGVTLATGDLILRKDQSSGGENGILVVQASGAPVRSTLADSAAKLLAMPLVNVREGTANADTVWQLTNDTIASLGTTALVYVKMEGAATKSIAAVTPAADKLPYYTSGTAAAVTDFTSFARTLVGRSTAALMRSDLGLSIPTAVREILTANRTYYVRTGGSDSNDGLTNTNGGAFLTIQKAVDVISGTLDISIYAVTIQVDTGTYTTPVVLKNCVGNGSLTLLGNTGTPASVLISTTSNNGISCTNLTTPYLVDGFKIQTTTSGHCIFAQQSYLTLGRLNFGACANYHIFGYGQSFIVFQNDYTISGGAQAHWLGSSSPMFECTSHAITTSGTPAFSFAFAYMTAGSKARVFGNTFPGTGATGSRYFAQLFSFIDSSGGGTTYLLGNSAGTPAAADTISADGGLYH